jgi:hypothetical protein
MKKYILSLGFIVALNLAGIAQVVETATDGLLPSRKTTAERIAMPATIAEGVHVYDRDTKLLWYWNGSIWIESSSSAADLRLVGTNNRFRLFAFFWNKHLPK